MTGLLPECSYVLAPHLTGGTRSGSHPRGMPGRDSLYRFYLPCPHHRRALYWKSCPESPCLENRADPKSFNAEPNAFCPEGSTRPYALGRGRRQPSVCGARARRFPLGRGWQPLPRLLWVLGTHDPGPRLPPGCRSSSTSRGAQRKLWGFLAGRGRFGGAHRRRGPLD